MTEVLSALFIPIFLMFGALVIFERFSATIIAMIGFVWEALKSD